MSWQAWLVLAVVLTVAAASALIASIDLERGHVRRVQSAAMLGALAAAAYVVSAAVAWPA